MLTRAQPFHLGHLTVLRKIAEENDKVLLLVGSANKEDTRRNPFPIDMRMEQIEDAICYYLPEKYRNKIKVVPLNDWSMEDFYSAAEEWGNYLYYTVVYFMGVKKFRFYYNDDIKIVQNWFNENIAKRVEIRTMNRTNTAAGISSTYLRNLILKEDYNTVKSYLLESVTDAQFLAMKRVLKQVERAPKDDFIME